MAEVNFDEFKAVVDYITSNTGNISASLKALIDNTIAVRSDSSLNIITSNTSIKKINIGSLSLDMQTLNLTGVNGIKIENDEFDVIRLSGGDTIPDNTLLRKSLSETEILAIASKFVSKTAQASSVQHYYASTVTSFADEEIPSMNKFFADFYSIKDIELDKPVIINSRDINGSNNVVSYAIGKVISGALKGKKSVSTRTKSIDSNLFFSNEDRTEIKTVFPKVVVNSSTSITSATSNKSVMTPDMLKRYIVKKNLSNIGNFVMQSPGSQNPKNIATPVFLDEYLATKSPLTQRDVDAKKDVKNGLDFTFATTGFFSSGTQEEISAISSIRTFRTLEDALLSDPAENGGLGTLSSLPEALIGSGSEARDRASSIRTTYALLSAEIVKRFPKAMMSGIDKLALSSQINLIMQDSDVEFYVRPIILASAEEGSEAGTFKFFLKSVTPIEKEARPVTSNWNYFG